MSGERSPYLSWKLFAALAALAVLPYLRSVWLPPIADDYLQVWLSRRYGPPEGWGALLYDPLYRSRATSLVMTHLTELIAGFSALVFNLSNLAVHIVNTWLVLLIGSWRAVGYRTAAVAAAFFAVYEGHQEAVIWYSALPETLVFLFGVAAFLCWTRWAESAFTRHRWLVASAAAFVLALYSKESAVAFLPLMGAALLFHRPLRRIPVLMLAAMGAAAAAYFWSIYAARSVHLHFNDGTFSLNAPFLETMAISAARLFWPWGVISAAMLAAWGRKRLQAPALALFWVAATFLPYSFLTYMNRVPSRHTYCASVGLALVFAAGVLACRDRLRLRPWVTAAFGAIVVLHNAGYIWTHKHEQYVKRAEPTEAVIRAIKAGVDPVYVHCFPYGFEAAQLAVLVGAEKPAEAVQLWDGRGEPPAGILCLNPGAPGPHPGLNSAAAQSGGR